MNNKSIRFRISVTFTVMIFVFAVIIIFYNYQNTMNNSYSFAKDIITQTTKLVGEKVENYLFKNSIPLSIIVKNNKNRSILDEKEENIINMREHLFQNESIASIFLADNFGNFLQLRRDPKVAIREISTINGKRVDFYDYRDKEFNSIELTTQVTECDPRKRFWFTDAKKDKVLITKPYIFKSTGKTGITLYLGHFDKFGEKISVGAIDITLTTLIDFLKEQSKYINGEIYIFDGKGEYIISSDLDKQDIKQVNSAYKNIVESDFVEISGEKMLLQRIDFSVGNDRWSIVATIPRDFILGEAVETLYITIAVSIVVLIIFILITLKVSDLITKPIIKLSKDIDSLKSLKTDMNLDDDSKILEIYKAQNSLIALRGGIESFKKYMPSDLVKILIDQKKEATIGGEEKELVVMFTDIKSFTTISETMSPSELTHHLSIYFDLMESIISRYDGTIDKYIGDAVMAFWGAPLDVDEPAKKATRCAVEIQKELEKLNRDWENSSLPRLDTRVGIHIGKTLVGNIGSNNRMNYTIIGDTVNVASRLEGINKNYNTDIIVSEEIFNIVNDDFNCRFLDEIALKGKTEATKIYTIS